MGLNYRPPSSQHAFEEQMCREIAESCKNIRGILLGNFNFLNIDWASII